MGQEWDEDVHTGDLYREGTDWPKEGGLQILVRAREATSKNRCVGTNFPPWSSSSLPDFQLNDWGYWCSLA